MPLVVVGSVVTTGPTTTNITATTTPTGRPDHDQQHCYHHALTVETEAATAVVELLMMSVRKPETC